MGQNNATGDARALFLKLYAGEVLTAFQSKNIMMPLHRVRTISKGKSAQFPMTGKYRDAGYHTPGKEIIPTAAKHGERIVSIDDLLINAQFIPNIDEAMSHFDIRSVYTQEAGFGLSKVADQNILRMAVKAALTESAAMAALATGATMVQGPYTAFDDEDFTQNIVIGERSGATSDIAYARDPQKLAQAIMDAKRVLDNANVPGDPFVVLSTDSYYDMFKISSTTPLSSLAIFNRDIGGGGSAVAGVVPNILGMPVYVTNHLGSFATTADDSVWNSSLWTIAANVGEHKTGVTTWGGEQPLASSVGSGRTTQYDTPSDNHAAWTTNVTNNNATASTRITARVSAVANRVIGLVMTKDAVATAKLMDMSVESEYQINRQGTLMVAKYAMGHNILRPACAVALIQGL
jgi:hypothetical protein